MGAQTMMRRPVFILAATLAVVAVAGVVLFQVALGGGGDKVSRLISEDRPHLSLCVDSAGGRQAEDADVDFVQRSLQQALASADYIPSEFGVPTTEAGCPPPLELSGARITMADRQRPEAFLDDAALVSPYRLFVYLVPPEDFIAAFRDSEYDFGIAEWLCSGRRVTPIAGFRGFRSNYTCEPMTTSVYVPDDVSREDLVDVFLYTLGLREQIDSTVDWQSCVVGSDAPYCEVYQVCIPPMRESPEFCEEFWDRTGLERP